jgi:hypothetical protein
MMPNTTLRVEIQIVALALWKCLLRRTRKIVVKRTLILKAKSTTIAMENGRPCAAPSVNTAYLITINLKLKVLILIFHLKNKSFINPYPSLLLDMLPSGLFLK